MRGERVACVLKSKMVSINTLSSSLLFLHSEAHLDLLHSVVGVEQTWLHQSDMQSSVVSTHHSIQQKWPLTLQRNTQKQMHEKLSKLWAEKTSIYSKCTVKPYTCILPLLCLQPTCTEMQNSLWLLIHISTSKYSYRRNDIHIHFFLSELTKDHFQDLWIS